MVQEKAIVHEWFGGCKRPFFFFHGCCSSYYTASADDTEEVRRLGMGRLLSDVSEKMYLKVTQGAENKLKLLVHSTHDTTLAGICKTLEVFDEKYVHIFPAHFLPRVSPRRELAIWSKFEVLTCARPDGQPSRRALRSNFSAREPQAIPKIAQLVMRARYRCSHGRRSSLPSGVPSSQNSTVRLPNQISYFHFLS